MINHPNRNKRKKKIELVAMDTGKMEAAFERWIDVAWPGLGKDGDRYKLARQAFLAGGYAATAEDVLNAEIERARQRRIDEFKGP